MAVTKYEIDVDECRAILKDVQTTKDECDQFDTLDVSVEQVESKLYSMQELLLTEQSAKSLDREIDAFVNDKLIKTFDSLMENLEERISAMTRAVNAYEDGDQDMYTDAIKDPTIGVRPIGPPAPGSGATPAPGSGTPAPLFGDPALDLPLGSSSPTPGAGTGS